MNPNCKYEAQTHWGWFRLDEGAYQDYLAGRLWITWVPGKPQANPIAGETYVPANITKQALRLRDAARTEGVYAVLCKQFPLGTVEIPYRNRMSDYPIDELSMSVRATNGLMRAGANTFGKLKTILEQENGLRSIRNLGIKSEKEINLSFFNACYALLTDGERAAWWQEIIDQAEKNSKRLR